MSCKIKKYAQYDKFYRFSPQDFKRISDLYQYQFITVVFFNRSEILLLIFF